MVIKDKPSPHSCGNRTYGGRTKPPNMRHVKPSQNLILLKISVFSNSSGETFIILVLHHAHKQTVKSNTMANANANDEVQKHVATITLSKLVSVLNFKYPNENPLI